MVITMMGINDGLARMPGKMSVPDSEVANFLETLKTYKLILILSQHIAVKLKGLDYYKLKNHAVESRPDLRIIDLKQVRAERENPILNKKALELKKIIATNPKNDRAYVELGRTYRDMGKLSEAVKLYKKAIETNPKNDRAYGVLQVLYTEIGDLSLSREYGKNAEELRAKYYLPMTVRSYHKLKGVLDKRKIVYVCAQYPLRSLGPLKRIFDGNTKGIIFVDNEKVFKDALAKSNYREYFRDISCGDFGHCTDKGNELLTENIANVILKEVFDK